MSNARRGLAILESPFQLLSFAEALAQGVVRADCVALLRGDAARSSQLVEMVRNHAGPALSIVVPTRLATVRGMVRDAEQLVIGDALSGFVHAVLALARPPAVVLLDDGTSTVDTVRRLARADSLRRPMAPTNLRRRVRASLASTRLRALVEDCRVTWFTALAELSATSIPTVAHAFEWTRSVSVPIHTIARPRVVLGSSLAADGLIGQGPYRQWLEREIGSGSVLFAPHRREQSETIMFARRLGAATVDSRGLPIELVVRDLDPSVVFASLPSTAVMTVPKVRRTTYVECSSIPQDWWTPSASPEFTALLDSVGAAAARLSDRHPSPCRSRGLR